MGEGLRGRWLRARGGLLDVEGVHLPKRRWMQRVDPGSWVRTRLLLEQHQTRVNFRVPEFQLLDLSVQRERQCTSLGGIARAQ